MNKLVDRGNTVLVIEHNMDVIKVADHIIDIGPEGGDGGGLVLFEGVPEDLVKVKESFTGKYLSTELKQKKSMSHKHGYWFKPNKCNGYQRNLVLWFQG